MNSDRQDLCLVAVSELATRLDLHQWLESQDETTSIHRIIAGNFARICSLASVLHDGLGDDVVTTDQVRAIVEQEAA